MKWIFIFENPPPYNKTHGPDSTRDGYAHNVLKMIWVNSQKIVSRRKQRQDDESHYGTYRKRVRSVSVDPFSRNVIKSLLFMNRSQLAYKLQTNSTASFEIHRDRPRDNVTLRAVRYLYIVSFRRVNRRAILYSDVPDLSSRPLFLAPASGVDPVERFPCFLFVPNATRPDDPLARRTDIFYTFEKHKSKPAARRRYPFSSSVTSHVCVFTSGGTRTTYRGGNSVWTGVI